MKKVWIPIIVISVLLLLLVGCKSEPSPTATTSAPETTTPVTSVSPTEPGSVTPQYGGTLRIIQGGDVMSLGYPPEAGGPETYYQRQPCIEQLVRMNEKGEIVPFLAESYQADPANLTVTFTLRKGVKFHDGSLLDAEVCKWNLDQLMAGSTTSIDFVYVASIIVVDDYTVQVKFKQWDSTFVRVMAWDASMISQSSFEKNGKEWAIDNPVGTGPFKLVNFQRDVSKEFDRFDDYWQPGKPYLDKIVINIIADPMTQIASFLKGEDDIISVLNPTDAVTLRNEPGVVVSTAKVAGGTTQALVGDSINPESPFAKLEVRQAISYAIDRQAIVDTIYKGYAITASQMGLPSHWSYNPDIVAYPYDIEKARQKMIDAGYPDGFETTIYFRNDKVYQDLFTAVQGYLAEIGIKSTLQPLELGKFFDMIYATGFPEGTMMQCPGGYDPEEGSTFWWNFSLTSEMPLALAVEQPQGLQDDIDGYYRATDFATKQKLIWEMQDIIYSRDLLNIPIISDYALAAKSSKVHDEYTCVIDYPPYTFADAWMEQ
jgi:peptide/nickel transport system substrate-binding protein